MFCPNCGAEYREGFTSCSACEVPLVSEPPDRKEPVFKNLVTVYEAGNLAILSFAKSILESGGIDYYCKGEGIQDLFGAGRLGTGYNPVLGPVQIQVAEEDAEKAKEILDQIEESQPVNSEAEDDSDEDEESEKPIVPEEPVEPEAAVTKNRGRMGFYIGLAVGLIMSGTAFLMYTYQRLPQTEVVKADFNNDSKPDMFWYYERGVLVRTERDRNFDGKIDEWCYYKKGVIDRCESDNGFSGRINCRSYYKNGLIARVEIDTNNDRKPEIVEHYTNGLIAERRLYHESTRKIWKRQLYKNGVLTQEYIDRDYKGAFDTIIEYNSSERPIDTR